MKNIVRWYPDNTYLLKSLSMEITSGENTIIVGRQGDGLDTLLRIVTGLEEPNEGNVEIFVESAYVAEDFPLVDNMRVKDYFQMLNYMKKNSAEVNRMFNILENIGLFKKQNWHVKNLSGYERCILSVGLAMYKSSQLLIMGNCIKNLSEKEKTQFWNHLSKWIPDVSVLFFTDDILCISDFDKKYTLNDGQLIELH